jgi:hypothetical protein
MNNPTRWAILSISVLFLGLALAQDGPDSVLRGTKEFRKSVLASGLAGPWELTWGPDNMLWVTERTGKRITRIDPASGPWRLRLTRFPRPAASMDFWVWRCTTSAPVSLAYHN